MPDGMTIRLGGLLRLIRSSQAEYRGMIAMRMSIIIRSIIAILLGMLLNVLITAVSLNVNMLQALTLAMVLYLAPNISLQIRKHQLLLPHLHFHLLLHLPLHQLQLALVQPSLV